MLIYFGIPTGIVLLAAVTVALARAKAGPLGSEALYGIAGPAGRRSRWLKASRGGGHCYRTRR